MPEIWSNQISGINVEELMDALRNLASANRSQIINIVYIIAFFVVLYYLYKFLLGGSELEATLLNIEVDANKVAAMPLPPTNPDIRVKQGGSYSLTFWMYITSWDVRAGLAKSVLQIMDADIEDYSLLTAILYPNEPKMMVRVHTEATNGAGTGATASTADYNKISNFDSLLGGQQGASMFNSTIEMPMCDVQDVDLQRWINFTIVVNGRIVDVYYDGKLTRSCVLPDIPAASSAGRQSVVIGNKGGFAGKMSGIQFFAYALTPDRIYSIYQAGPRGAASFMGYLAEKLGIKLTYSGAGGVQKTIGE